MHKYLFLSCLAFTYYCVLGLTDVDWLAITHYISDKANPNSVIEKEMALIAYRNIPSSRLGYLELAKDSLQKKFDIINFPKVYGELNPQELQRETHELLTNTRFQNFISQQHVTIR